MRGLSPEGYGAVMRPEILFSLYSPITTLKGVGPRVAPLLERVAGPIVRDVLWLRPHSVVHRTTGTLADAIDGQVMTFDVVINDFQRPRTNAQPWRVRVADETGFLTLAFFGGFGGQLEQRHPVGARRLVSGRVEETKFGRQMVHPDYMVDPAKAEEIPEVEAIYPATEGLPPRRVRGFALEALAHAPDLPEWQDPAFVARERFPTWREALVRMHHPESDADLSPLSVHRRRLAYDELLAHQLAMAQRKAARRREPAPTIPTGELARKVRADLPFALTGAQERALADVHADFQAGERMSRLIQGDVGSGKTVVAMLAMADVAEAGGQSALMAPTEILARQHFETLSAPLAAHGIGVVLLTGRDKGAARAEKLRALASGAAQVAVGTHALFQDEVAFHRLQLVVIDEQHRFGVAERQRLQAKGEAVHLAAMSATPIPRTLELTMYGDLDVSQCGANTLLERLPVGVVDLKVDFVHLPGLGSRAGLGVGGDRTQTSACVAADLQHGMHDQVNGNACGCEHHADGVDQEGHVVRDDGDEGMRRLESIPFLRRVEDPDHRFAGLPRRADPAVQRGGGREYFGLALCEILLADPAVVVARELALGTAARQCSGDALDDGQTATGDTLWHGCVLAQGRLNGEYTCAAVRGCARHSSVPSASHATATAGRPAPAGCAAAGRGAADHGVKVAPEDAVRRPVPSVPPAHRLPHLPPTVAGSSVADRPRQCGAPACVPSAAR